MKLYSSGQIILTDCKATHQRGNPEDKWNIRLGGGEGEVQVDRQLNQNLVIRRKKSS